MPHLLKAKHKLMIFIECMAYVSPPQTLAKLIPVIEGVAYASPPRTRAKLIFVM